MKIGNIDLVEFGNIVPKDEELGKTLNLKTLIKADWKSTTVAILEAIIAYNQAILEKHDKAYRMTYYITMADHLVTIPDYEELDPSKQMLIISQDGIGTFQQKHLEILPIAEIKSIGSDYFTTDGYSQYENYFSNTKKVALDYSDKIKEMRIIWTKSNANNENSIKKFMEDMTIINSLQSYNRRQFYTAKRDYIKDFLNYLIHISQNPDGSISKEDIAKIKAHYDEKFVLVNRFDAHNI